VTVRLQLNDVLRTTTTNEILGQTRPASAVSDYQRTSPFYYSPAASPMTPDTPLIDLTRSDTGGDGDHSVSSSTPDCPDDSSDTPVVLKIVKPQTMPKQPMPALFLQGLIKLKLKFQQFEEKTRRTLHFCR